ncbi:MAG: hypothetical protein ABIZ04_02820 [Opitutus sp.]
MLSRSRKRSPAGWPFWLLILAWVCANSPQAAVHGVIGWVGEARHFSHQQRLQAELSVALTGDQASSVLVAVKDEATKPFNLPAAPVDSGCTKFHLAVQETKALPPPAIMAAAPWAGLIQVANTIRDRPPHEPPRARLIV